jgi:thiol-disulfide isomerase/thioredoxin
LTGYNADDVEMLAKKSVPSGINDQKYYRWRLKFYRFFSLELVQGGNPMLWRRRIQYVVFLCVLGAIGVVVAQSVFRERATYSVGDALPPFQVELLDGSQFHAEKREKRPLIINFWGSFCPPCVEETPLLQRMYVQYAPQGLDILGINLGEKPIVRIESFVQQYGVTYPIGLDPHLLVRDVFGVRQYPTTFFIGADGRLQDVYVGGMTEDVLTTRIDALLASSSRVNPK